MAAVHTIPAHVPFLEALAAELVRRPVDVLADTLVLLPSRRACLALRDELARAAGERTLLLPRLQPVGEIEPDELLIDPSAELDLPPALPPLRRHLLLTRLVLAKDRGITHEQAVRLAGELMRFLDEVATENVPLAGLDGLVKGELAEHWQQTLEFLQLLTQVWPEVVAEQGFIDPVERRNRLLAAWAARWRPRAAAAPRHRRRHHRQHPEGGRAPGRRRPPAARLHRAARPRLRRGGGRLGPRRRRPPAALPEATARARSASTAPPSSAGRTRASPAARPSARTCWPR